VAGRKGSNSPTYNPPLKVVLKDSHSNFINSLSSTIKSKNANLNKAGKDVTVLIDQTLNSLKDTKYQGNVAKGIIRESPKLLG